MKFTMKTILLSLLLMLTLSTTALAGQIGFTFPGYSALDILNQSTVPLSNGVYIIDPDLPGGDAPFNVYADMWSDGGGWTLASNGTIYGAVPDLSNQLNAIDILAVSQTAEIRFVTDTFDAYFSGNYYSQLPSNHAYWTVLSGNPPDRALW